MALKEPLNIICLFFCFLSIVPFDVVGKSHRCSCVQYYTVYHRHRYHANCGFWGWSRCAHYRKTSERKQRTLYRCCPGYWGTFCDLPPERPSSISVMRDSAKPSKELFGTLYKNRDDDHLVTYRVRLEENGVANSTKIPSSSGFYRFTGLVPGAKYRVQGWAVGRDGKTKSPHSVYTQYIYNDPLPIASIMTSVQSPHSIDVWWSPDPRNSRAEFDVTYEGEFVETFISDVIKVGGTNTTLEGLYPGERYHIEVQAVSHGQASKVSTTSAVTYPYNPERLEAPVEHITAHTVRLEWTFHRNTSYNTGWRITVENEQGIIKDAFEKLDPLETSVTLNDLLPLHNYKFSVHGITVDDVINSTGLSITAKTVDVCYNDPCTNGGKCSHADETFKCSCPDGYAGKICQDKILKPPTLVSLNPRFGPEAGGTVITIAGADLITPVESVVIGGPLGYQCDIRNSTRTHIEATTPPINTTDAPLNVPLSLVVVFPGGLKLVGHVSFEYRANPSVEKIHPLSTIIDGGTTLTVEGVSLDAVKYAVLEVTMIFEQNKTLATGSAYLQVNKTFESQCDISNSTSILCKTPSITLPGGSQISVSDTEADVTTDSPADSRSDQANLQNRQPETVVNFQRPDSRLTFYLGLKFDGLDTYRHLSSHNTLKKYAILKIYKTPQIEPSDEVIEFESSRPLKIQGYSMDGGVKDRDYDVAVGTGECEMMKLETSKLTCMPPQSEPRRHNWTVDGHEIRVHIGTNIEIAYGKLHYGRKPVYPVYVWILVGVFVTIILAGVIIAPILVIRNRHRRAVKESVDDKKARADNKLTPRYGDNEVNQGPVQEDQPRCHRGSKDGASGVVNNVYEQFTENVAANPTYESLKY